jgi:DUF2889 family protein
MIEGLVKNPLSSTPPRPPGSVRRSSHIDMIWLPAPGVEAGGSTRLVLVAGARDVVTGADGAGTVVAPAQLVAWVGPGNRLEHLETSPALPGSDALVGASAAGGFRKAARSMAVGHEHDPIGLLLDDLPVAVLISGYSELVRRRIPRALGADDPAGHMRDLCSGWRSGGTMIASLERGEGVPVPSVSDAPDLRRPGDPLSIEDTPDLPVGSLRRRRRIDVMAGDPVRVEATFRDTFRSDDAEGVLHEYLVEATCDPRGRLLAITAEPRVLPWPECPAAGEHVARLAGMDLSTFGRSVQQTLTSIESCTHLNDLLRSLSCVPHLISLRP